MTATSESAALPQVPAITIACRGFDAQRGKNFLETACMLTCFHRWCVLSVERFPADVIEALRQEQQCDRKMLQRGEDNRNLSKTVLKPPSSSVNNECRLKRISRRHRARRPDRPTKRGSLLPLSLQTLSVVGDGKETRPPPPPAAPWTPSNPSSTLISTYSRHDTKHGADYRRRNSGRGFPRNHTYGTNELNGFDQNAQGAEGPRGDDNVFSKTPQASDSASVMSQIRIHS